MSIELEYVDETVQRLGRGPEAVIPILQALQEHYGYLPEQALRKMCLETQITPAAAAGVASFYDMFRHQPAGKYIIRVCRGTACHVTGAERVEDALRRTLRIAPGQDTDDIRRFTIEGVACLGCCTLAPVVRIGERSFGHVTSEKVPSVLHEFERDSGRSVASPENQVTAPARSTSSVRVNIGLGSCCIAKGSDRLFEELRTLTQQKQLDVTVKRVGCVGMCHRTPMLEVTGNENGRGFYSGLDPVQAREFVLNRFANTLPNRIGRMWNNLLDRLLLDTNQERIEPTAQNRKSPEFNAFLGRQVHIATEHFGEIDPLDLDEYIEHGGFAALAQCVGVTAPAVPGKRPQPNLLPQGEVTGTAPLHQTEGYPPGTASPDELSPEQIITCIERSGLRGRGGAGFPTGAKWRLGRQQAGEAKYVICNGDEGDPGAFMDRMLLESFPYRIIEGLAVTAVAIGAHEGIFYIRHEYPLAVQRIRAAIKLCEKRGWLGKTLLGSNYSLRLTIKEGAGAFVCGEETALIASIEGQRGMPRLRPPFPVEQGLWAKPTIINNVETLALVPWIIRNGAEAFAAYGTQSSKGTKVFALAGNIRRGGLIEIPMGTRIAEIVQEIGGGVPSGRTFKAVQIGGPSGGCIPARLADTAVDYESLRDVGAIMGSGGLIVLDDNACMVDLARYFLQFTQNQSCGKCTFCRIGTRRMLDILERLCSGRGQKQDLAELERLGNQVGAGSLCGLGKTAPNPVLTTLRYFRNEYEAHLHGRCPAGKCTALIKYKVTEACIGCTICAQHCPVNAIPLAPYQRHVIKDEKCTRCDTCRKVCPHSAIVIE